MKIKVIIFGGEEGIKIAAIKVAISFNFKNSVAKKAHLSRKVTCPNHFPNGFVKIKMNHCKQIKVLPFSCEHVDEIASVFTINSDIYDTAKINTVQKHIRGANIRA